VRARRAVGVLVAAVATALAGCTAHTVPPSDVAFTAATLRASGECGGGELCAFYFEWGPAGGALPNRTPVRYLTGPASSILGERVTGLPAGGLVDYRLSGSSNLGDFKCVGEDGTSATRQRFRVASPPPAKYAPPALAAPMTIRPTCGDDGMAYPHDGGGDGLSPDKDYIVDLGGQRLECSLWIVGGRNVVVRDGEIWIPRRGDARATDAVASTHYEDQTGQAFATELLIDGDDTVTPMALNERPGATVTAERVRAANMRSHYAGAAALAAAASTATASRATPGPTSCASTSTRA
jgi:hypothetical protein